MATGVAHHRPRDPSRLHLDGDATTAAPVGFDLPNLPKVANERPRDKPFPELDLLDHYFLSACRHKGEGVGRGGDDGNAAAELRGSSSSEDECLASPASDDTIAAVVPANRVAVLSLSSLGGAELGRFSLGSSTSTAVLVAAHAPISGEDRPSTPAFDEWAQDKEAVLGDDLFKKIYFPRYANNAMPAHATSAYIEPHLRAVPPQDQLAFASAELPEYKDAKESTLTALPFEGRLAAFIQEEIERRTNEIINARLRDRFEIPRAYGHLRDTDHDYDDEFDRNLNGSLANKLTADVYEEVSPRQAEDALLRLRRSKSDSNMKQHRQVYHSTATVHTPAEGHVEYPPGVQYHDLYQDPSKIHNRDELLSISAQLKEENRRRNILCETSQFARHPPHASPAIVEEPSDALRDGRMRSKSVAAIDLPGSQRAQAAVATAADRHAQSASRTWSAAHAKRQIGGWPQSSADETIHPETKPNSIEPRYRPLGLGLPSWLKIFARRGRKRS